MSESQSTSTCLNPPATIIEVDIDYEAHFNHAWDESQALWVADELDRQNRAAAAICDRAPPLPVDCEDNLAPLSSPRSRILSNTASNVSLPHPAQMSITDDPLPCHTYLPPLPDQRASDQPPEITNEPLNINTPTSPSEHPSTPRLTVSYLDGSELSDCDSIAQEGSRKRRRREDAFPEKIAREREKKKAKKARHRQEGTLRPRKKSDTQKERKRPRNSPPCPYTHRRAFSLVYLHDKFTQLYIYLIQVSPSQYT